MAARASEEAASLLLRLNDHKLPQEPPQEPQASSKKRKRVSSAKGKNFTGDAFFPDGMEPPEEAWKPFCQRVQAAFETQAQFRGVAFQLERCPETKRLHIQFNALYKNTVPPSVPKSLLEGLGLKPPHVEFTKDPQASWKYAQKDDTRVHGPYTSGEGPKVSGSRSDLVEFVKDCKTLSSEAAPDAEEFEMRYLMIQARYPKFYEKFVGKHEPKRVHKTYVVVLWGLPGTGKSRFAQWLFERAGGPVYKASYPPTRTSHIAWFYGYEGQPNVLCDEFEGSYPLSLFKELTGDLECKVKIGNGQSERQWRPSLMVICSNSDPDTWYGIRQDVFRRFDVVAHLDYSSDYPLNLSKGPHYALDVVRNSRMAVTQCLAGDSFRDDFLSDFATFQKSVPVAMAD